MIQSLSFFFLSVCQMLVLCLVDWAYRKAFFLSHGVNVDDFE